jgi:hypothetical protein
MEVRMRKRIIVLLISLLFIGIVQLTANTIIDSIYATPELDGDILFRQSIQNFIVFTNYYAMCAGDLGTSLIEPDPNSIFRSYISFYLPEIPASYELDSTYVRLYQYSSCGDGDVYGNQEPFPLFYGEELPCIMDHIDYGDMLDISDWTKGDTGEPGTLQSNIGCISDNGDDGYRYLDITQYVLDDYNNDRYQTQYRIRFEVDTDWDNLTDKLGFLTSWDDPEHDPMLVLFFKSIITIDNEVNFIDKIKVYPNPFINSTNISFTARQGQVREIGVYNLKGQLVRTLELRDSDLGFSAEWDGRDEDGNEVCNGVYFYSLEFEDTAIVKKLVKVKN